MEPNTQQTKIQAYGKCKCVNRRDGKGCVRCHRLNKPCVPMDSARKAAAQSNINPVDRIAQLESKLDGLITALCTGSIPPSGASPGVGDMAGTNAAVPANGQSQAFSQPSAGASTTATSMAVAGFTSTLPAQNTPVNTMHQAPATGLVASDLPLDVEECLQTFCHSMLRPFLLLCICAASSKSTDARAVLGERIKQTVADRLVVNSHGIVNIDLLLGLLVFIAWGYDALLKVAPNSLSRFTHQAMLVVFELRLNRQPTDETNMLSISSTHGEPSTIRVNERTHSLEERRAVLGCFYISAVISTYFGQIDALQWTPYMEESLTILGHQKESLIDESFVHQVRLQLISNEMETVRHSTVPPHFYLRALQAKLDGVKKAISPEIQKDSSKSRHGNFPEAPPTEYPAVPFSQFVQIARYIKVVVALSTLQDPTWDTNMVRQTADVLQFVDQVLSNIQTASGGEMRSGVTFLAGAFRVFTAVRAWCASKLVESPALFDPFEPTGTWTGRMFNAFAFEGLDFFT
ncbi:hypothetical protein PG999_007315 [Apiospora kogelbergensis]|uniref:Zn(2)-C6 fungal-type domain-containing protein n=1 Tax=Apiospora kogelbergensis TaxID=1337665 RepID=A0AAW0QXY5_9PEZI